MTEFGGFVEFLIAIDLIIISVSIIVAPLLIWRNGNRTNRLLALIALQSGVSENKIQEAYFQDGTYFLGQITSMSDKKAEGIANEINKRENQNLIDAELSHIKSFFSEFEWIEPSPYKFYALVKNGPEYLIVEIGGFKPEIVPSSKLDYMPRIKEWMENFLKSSDS